MKKIIAIALSLIMIISLVACGKREAKYNLTFSTREKEIGVKLMSEDTFSKITLSENDAKEIKSMIKNIKVNFPYSDLYKTEECYNRLKTNPTVEQHNLSALDESGKLDANHLLSIVKKNNEEYFADMTYGTVGLESPEEEYLLEICRLIVDTINELRKKQPNIDYDRVYCNLGNLKIMYKKGMVDNAQVTSDMVMNISPNMFQIVNLMSNENGCRNVVIHEIMHIVQIGCPCEAIEHCTRRCGISYRWDDFDFNTSDFGWFFEGSAERSMCNLTGDKLFTYEYMINYVCSLNLCTLLNEDNPANYAETISFYDDAEMLYDMFGCETQEETFEILNMMIAINIIQMQPEELLEAYASQYNLNIEEQAVKDGLNCTLKPAIVTVFTKYFYNNLVSVLNKENDITVNDLCFIIALFEATLDNHIKYTNEKYNQYNTDFLGTYKSVRNALFEKINIDDGSDISAIYSQYNIFNNEDKKTVNASLKWNTDEKNLFMLERVEYLEFNINSKIN